MLPCQMNDHVTLHSFLNNRAYQLVPEIRVNWSFDAAVEEEPGAKALIFHQNLKTKLLQTQSREQREAEIPFEVGSSMVTFIF